MLIGGLALAPAVAQAQQQQQLNPEQMRATMSMMFKTMIDVYADPQMAESMATFYWNLYQALIKKGFSKEEALAITRAQSLMKGGQ
jgi:hypothetical protein